jgi:undecaprenyl pyrophosphate phosphatase UppP
VWLIENVLIKYKFLSSSLITESFRNLSNAPTLLILFLYFFKHWIFLIRLINRRFILLIKYMGLIVFTDSITVGWYFLLQGVQPSWFSYSWGFLITACFLFSLRFVKPGSYQHVTYGKALLIGCAQGIALLPGISRLGLTYSVARFMHIPPYKAFVFSCTIQIPLLIAALLKTSMLDPSYTFFFIQFLANASSLFLIIIALISAYCFLGCVEIAVRRDVVWKWSFYLFVPCILSLLI